MEEKSKDSLLVIIGIVVFAMIFSGLVIFNVQDDRRKAIEAAQPKPLPTEVEKAQKHFKYFKDPRTNVCFVGSYNYYNTFYTLTQVSCTPEVEKLLEPLP